MKYRWGIQDEEQYHNRTNVGQISGIREDDGIMTVRLTTGAIHKMPIPVLGFSPPIVGLDNQTLRSGARSSWMRYMPQVGDFVKVAFGPDNRPEAVGAATWGDLPSERGPQGQLGGYAQVSRARDRGEAGLSTFYRLAQGEWDMRSSGNAYIRGGQFGTLYLAGGSQQLLLKKEQEEVDGRMGLLRLDSTGAKLRFGDVKRQASGDFEEKVVSGSAKEWDLDLQQQTAPAPVPPTPYARVRYADIRDDSGAVINNLRLREELFEGGGFPLPNTTPVYTRDIDNGGNVSENGDGTRDVTSGGTHTVTAPEIKLGSSGASEAYVLGNAQLAELQGYLQTVSAQMTAMASAFSALAGVPVFAPGASQFTALATAATAIGTEAAARAAALPATLSTKITGE
jgi:hypothetical protein